MLQLEYELFLTFRVVFIKLGYDMKRNFKTFCSRGNKYCRCHTSVLIPTSVHKNESNDPVVRRRPSILSALQSLFGPELQSTRLLRDGHTARRFPSMTSQRKSLKTREDIKALSSGPLKALARNL